MHPGTPLPVWKAFGTENELVTPGGVITKVAIVTQDVPSLGTDPPSITADPASPALMTTWGAGTPVTPPSMPFGDCFAVISACPPVAVATTVG